MPHKHTPRVAKALDLIAELGNYDRGQLFEELRRNYCLGCGDTDPLCQCGNDD